MIRVHLMGLPHRLRNHPLSHEATRSLVADQVECVEDPAKADIFMFAHPMDLQDAGPSLLRYLDTAPSTQVMLLSEEPLWDTTWQQAIERREQSLEVEGRTIPFVYLNHWTSTVFDFERVPYFLLTNHSFFPRYAVRFRRNAQLSASDWMRHFRSAKWRAVFMAEKRVSDKFATTHLDRAVRGLSVYRTQVAMGMRSAGVLRKGRGWGAKGYRRQDLVDWHLEKLVELDKQCRMVSAIENTHQRNYVTEKIFDAFAVGAVPLYYSAPGHWIERIIPHTGWLNLYGMTPDEAADYLEHVVLDSSFAAGYVDAQRLLAERFSTPAAFVQERRRLRHALLEELSALF